MERSPYQRPNTAQLRTIGKTFSHLMDPVQVSNKNRQSNRNPGLGVGFGTYQDLTQSGKFEASETTPTEQHRMGHGTGLSYPPSSHREFGQPPSAYMSPSESKQSAQKADATKYESANGPSTDPARAPTASSSGSPRALLPGYLPMSRLLPPAPIFSKLPEVGPAQDSFYSSGGYLDLLRDDNAMLRRQLEKSFKDYRDVGDAMDRKVSVCEEKAASLQRRIAYLEGQASNPAIKWQSLWTRSESAELRVKDLDCQISAAEEECGVLRLQLQQLERKLDASRTSSSVQPSTQSEQKSDPNKKRISQEQYNKLTSALVAKDGTIYGLEQRIGDMTAQLEQGREEADELRDRLKTTADRLQEAQLDLKRMREDDNEPRQAKALETQRDLADLERRFHDEVKESCKAPADFEGREQQNPVQRQAINAILQYIQDRQDSLWLPSTTAHAFEDLLLPSSDPVITELGTFLKSQVDFCSFYNSSIIPILRRWISMGLQSGHELEDPGDKQVFAEYVEELWSMVEKSHDWPGLAFWPDLDDLEAPERVKKRRSEYVDKLKTWKEGAGKV